MVLKSERLELRLPSEILDRIDGWRSEHPDLPSRSEAVRQLIEIGLGRPEDDQLFQMARFSVLSTAKLSSQDPVLSDDYVYAWDHGVFPMFHEGARLHLPFAAQFAVTKTMLDELSKYLDDRRQAREVPTFYQLEDYYNVRSGRSEWDRSKLISACRYMFLNDLFDKPFWTGLLKSSDHPTEAKSIVRPFDRNAMYFS